MWPSSDLKRDVEIAWFTIPSFETHAFISNPEFTACLKCQTSSTDVLIKDLFARCNQLYPIPLAYLYTPISSDIYNSLYRAGNQFGRMEGCSWLFTQWATHAELLLAKRYIINNLKSPSKPTIGEVVNQMHYMIGMDRIETKRQKKRLINYLSNLY